jgi:hypothetical protein
VTPGNQVLSAPVLDHGLSIIHCHIAFGNLNSLHIGTKKELARIFRPKFLNRNFARGFHYSVVSPTKARLLLESFAPNPFETTSRMRPLLSYSPLAFAKCLPPSSFRLMEVFARIGYWSYPTRRVPFVSL